MLLISEIWSNFQLWADIYVYIPDFPPVNFPVN